jgi:hypothetical protein
MTPFPTITPLMRHPDVWAFGLADNLTPTEKIHLTRNGVSTLALFRYNFPDIYAWLRMMTDDDIWYVCWRLGSVRQENWVIELVIDVPQLAECFIQAWCEDDNL